jgi:hypothetical protein
VTDLLDDLHARVALNLLDANNALTVFDGAVSPPYPGPPYVLVYTDVAWSADPDAAGSSLDHTSATCTTTWTIHCVGATAAACRALTMQVRASLLDVQGTVTGRACFRLTEEDSQVPIKDETTGQVVMDAVVTYQMTSVPG